MLLLSLQLSPFDWAVAGLCGLLVGFTKTGVAGIGILTIPLMAMIFPAHQSPGVLLPMLIMGDILAVCYYHRYAVWSHLARLMPWAVVGILAAFAVLKHVTWTEESYSKLLGFIVLGCILSIFGLGKRQNKLKAGGDIPQADFYYKSLAGVFGVLGGVATMLANAAGSIWSIYLLAVGLPKYSFVGTGAWFYLIVNLLKVPFQVDLGNITFSSVAFNFLMLPFILLGGVIGICVLPRIDQGLFNRLILVLAAVAGMRLIFS